MKSDLLDAYLCGDLRGESAAFIEAALKSDAALREVYFQQVRMDAALRVLLADEELSEVTPERFADGVMARLASESRAEGGRDDERRFAKSVLTEILDERGTRPRPMSGWDWAKAAGVAAAAVAALVVVLQSVSVDDAVNRRGGLGETPARFVARITAEETGAVWSVPAPLDATTTETETPDGARKFPIVDGEGWVRPGRLTLESGVAEVTFNSGARVFLEGPAVLEVERPNRAFLASGRLTAEVPKPATGFVINTPRVNVVDIGTRFGVSVESGGDTEVHVMQGVVEVSRLSGNASPMVVEEGLAVRADGRTRSELRVIDYAGDQFALRVSEGSHAAQVAGFLRYDFDESGGSEIEDSGRGLEGAPFHASLFPDANEPARPKRSVGRIGGGLVFSPGERLDSPLLSGFGSDEPLSVALWVRVPPRPEHANANTILSLIGAESALDAVDGAETVPALWQLSWNPDPGEGTVGALRIESRGRAFVVGSTDLRDGRWHHIAFRYAGGAEADMVTHSQLYVDGQLENVSGYREGEASGGVIRRLHLGGAGNDEAFEGVIDEVHVFLDAVTPGVFQKLAAGDSKL